MHGHVIYTKSYRRMHKRISHAVLFQHFEAIELESVLYFVYEKQSQLFFAVCEKLKLIGQVKRQVGHILKVEGAQWPSGRVLDSRPKVCRFEPHQRRCVVVLEQDTFILAKYWFNPGRLVPI